jgi:hypothetical protein
MLTHDAFEKWLTAYGAAWQSRDSRAAVRLFSRDAHYHWTPVDPPMVGHDGIAAAWDGATGTQQDITFRHTIWSVTNTRGIAHWNAHFTRIGTGLPVDIDGVLLADFDGAGLCRVFREWWHSTETA